MRRARFIPIVLFSLFLLFGCDFLEERLDKPVIRLVSVALDYEGMENLGELSATLNDQWAMRLQLQHLAKQGGYEYKAYSLRQEGFCDFQYPSSIDLYYRTSGETLILEALEIGPESTISTRGARIVECYDTSSFIDDEGKLSSADLSIPRGIIFNIYVDGSLKSSVSGDAVDGYDYRGDATLEGKKDIVDSYSKAVSDYMGYIGDKGDSHRSNGLSLRFYDILDQIEKEAKPSDITIFQFSGHAGSDSGSETNGYLAFGDHDYVYPMDLGFELDDIQGKKLLIIDACYSGAFDSYFSFFAPPFTFSQSLDTLFSFQVPLDDDIWVLSASRSFEVSSDGGEGNLGLFSGKLLKALGAVVADPVAADQTFASQLKDAGIHSFVEPGLPGTDSIWVSDLLFSIRKETNPLKLHGRQYAMGDSILDLELFTDLK